MQIQHDSMSYYSKLADIHDSLAHGRQEKPIIWTYWENPPEKNTPKMISDCFESMLNHCGDAFEVVFLNEVSIKTFINDIDPRVYLFECIAHRADYFRFFLLYRYGGIWLDADTMCFKSFLPFTEILRSKKFICTGYYQVNGEFFPLIAFLASEKGHIINELMLKNIENFFDKLANGINPSWDELGGRYLAKILEQFPAHRIDITKFSPIQIWNFPQIVFLKRDRLMCAMIRSSYCQMLSFSNMSCIYDFFDNEISLSQTNLGYIREIALLTRQTKKQDVISVTLGMTRNLKYKCFNFLKYNLLKCPKLYLFLKKIKNNITKFNGLC